MENASQALVMAGQVLIFMIALSVCISSFTTAREGIDRIIDQTETIEMAKDDYGYINYVEGNENGAIRRIGIETLVSSMYRAIKENYVIYLKLNPPNWSSLNKINTIIATQDINVKTNSNQIKTIINKGDRIAKITIGNNTNQNVNEILSSQLYKYFQSKNNMMFDEYLGEYQDASEEGVATENKQTNRIITYIETT